MERALLAKHTAMTLQNIITYLRSEKIAAATKKLITKQGEQVLGISFHVHSNTKDRWIDHLTSLTGGKFKVSYVNEEINIDL